VTFLKSSYKLIINKSCRLLLKAAAGDQGLWLKNFIREAYCSGRKDFIILQKIAKKQYG
jgi:hypothetical protein